MLVSVVKVAVVVIVVAVVLMMVDEIVDGGGNDANGNVSCCVNKISGGCR